MPSCTLSFNTAIHTLGQIMSQPFYFVLIGYVQSTQAFCTRCLEVHGSMCALRLHHNTSLGHCQKCSYQATSPGATQLVKFLLTLSGVRLAIWQLLSLPSYVIHISRHVFDHKTCFPKRFLCILVCLFWLYVLPLLLNY